MIEKCFNVEMVDAVDVCLDLTTDDLLDEQVLETEDEMETWLT